MRFQPFSFACLVLTTATAATAQEPKPESSPAKTEEAASFEAVDHDKDGQVSEAEFSAYMVKESFDYHDTNDDNAIPEAEAKQAAAQTEKLQKKARKTTAKTQEIKMEVQFKQADANGDGKLTQKEIRATVKQQQPKVQTIFGLVDTDKSKTISRDEWFRYQKAGSPADLGIPILRINF